MAEQKNLDLNAVWRVIEKFKESVLRLGINLYEQFQRFDPSREQLIGEYFFRKVLEVCLRNEVPLSEDEIKVLLNYFQYRDGRIMYSELCDRVHDRDIELSTNITANLMTGLEWEDPLHINALKIDEEEQLQNLLNNIARILIRSDHPIDVHFKEYEQIARNPGCVSFNHLARILRSMSINLCQSDYNLLIKRYSRHNYLFNYIPFLDELNTAIKCVGLSGDVFTDIRYVINSEPDKVKRPDIFYPKSSDRGKELGLPVSFRLLGTYKNFEEGPLLTMRRIKKHVLGNGIDLFRIFRDLDKLNWGYVSGENFKRAITNCGINCGVNSKFNLTQEDINDLIKIYTKPYTKDVVMWRLFIADVTSGLLKHEITTNIYDETSDLRFMPPQGNVWSTTSEETRLLCEETLNRLKVLLKARRWFLRPFFIEWDPTKSGNVDILRFRNILSSNNLVTDPKELDAIEKRYVNSKGFDYNRFFDELRIDKLEEAVSSKIISSTKMTKESIDQLVDPCYKREYTDDELSDSLRKIRKQIVVNSLKLDDYFKQFDPLNKFTVSNQEFLRVLASTKIQFNKDDEEILVSLFKAPFQPGRFDYQRFLDVINEAYTQKYLDKAPLIVPVKHIPVIDDPKRFLNMNERRTLESVLDRLSNKLAMIHYDDFRYFDTIKAGDLGRNQFIKLLDSFKIKLKNIEIDTVFKAFGRHVGGILYLEYLPFLNAIDILFKQKKA